MEEKHELERLFELGLTYNKLHDYDEALGYFQQSLKIAIKLNDNKLTDKIITNIGNSYDTIAEKHLDSLEYRLNSVITMQKNLPDIPATSIQIARILNNIGNEYLRAGKYTDSLNFFIQSFETIKTKVPNDHPYLHLIVGNIILLCKTLNNEGTIYLTLEQYDEALQYFSKSFIILKKIFPQGNEDIIAIYGNIIKTGAILHGIGRQYLQANKEKEALNIFAKISDAVLQHVISEPALNLINPLNKTSV